MGAEIMKIIKQAAIDAVEQKTPTAITYGTVTKTSPLEILVEDRFKVQASMLLLTADVIDRQTKISFDNPEVINEVDGYLDPQPEPPLGPHNINRLRFLDKTIKNDITIYDALKVGEKVMLLRIQGGQKFIVLDRLVSAK